MNNKYDVEDTVYILDYNRVVECKIIEITKSIMSITYKLVTNNFIEYKRPESEVFKNEEEANKWASKLKLKSQINDLNCEISEYKDWISELDYAIQNYENCETDMTIRLLSNQTNGKDEIIFAVKNSGSKTLLECIKKYFEGVFNKKEKELIRLKEQLKEKIKKD